MKLISWNVNGLRAVLQKGFLEFFTQEEADFFCLQETKIQAGQVDLSLEGYHIYYNYAIKKGYSGTAIFAKQPALSVRYDVLGKHTDEGRMITLEYENFYLVNVYVPNAQEELKRLEYRMEWEDDFRAYLNELAKQKAVIVCGDMNVAKEEIDLKNPKSNTKNPGFSIEERTKMRELLASGFTDSFRYFYPDATDQYTWWSYRFKAREKNIGWRIDYFLIDTPHESALREAKIYQDVLGSDHCPVGITVEL
ncbi:MAG: exodeoxyribonuclease III [Erysipelotrichaceae bacterium]|nr:exodeoxyribonuclease III [Erysipelotrichaceae bacterium]MBR3693406.1 exodeoxyribonuclease III [Erysipelotrichales bacterium]